MKIVTSMVLFNTHYAVAHNKVVSVFDVIKEQWVHHFYFPDTIYNICKCKVGNDYNTLGVILENGGVTRTITYDEEAPAGK